MIPIVSIDREVQVVQLLKCPLGYETYCNKIKHLDDLKDHKERCSKEIIQFGEVSEGMHR